MSTAELEDRPVSDDPSAPRRAPAAFVAALLVLALVIAGASIVVLRRLAPPTTRSAAVAPAGSALFASIFVEPSVGQSRALRALTERSELSSLLPEGNLVERMLDPFLSDLGLDYARDVEPWLGREIGISMSGTPEGDPQILVMFEARDADAARDVLGSARIEARERTHAGTSYRIVGGDGRGAPRWAVGVIGDFLVAGTPRAAFESAVDAAEGTALADDAAFDTALGTLPDDRLVAIYLKDPAAAAGLPLPPIARGIAGKLIGGQEAVPLAIQAESDAVEVATGQGEPVRLEARVLAELIQIMSLAR